MFIGCSLCQDMDFNKEIQAKKKSILHIYRFMKNGYTLAPLIASATFMALNDYIENLKKQRELGVTIADQGVYNDETIKMINKIIEFFKKPSIRLALPILAILLAMATIMLSCQQAED